MRRVCVVTGSRADYGLLVWVMKAIDAHSDLELIPVATGAHLEAKWGHTVDQIRADGFADVHEVPVFSGSTTPRGISDTIAQTVTKFAAYFEENPPDILAILGDRYEILGVALAAMQFNLPIAHLGGGEISEGAVDDSIRHALTKLSHYHLAITERCAERIRQLGEEPDRVFVVGSPRLDFLTRVGCKPKSMLCNEYGVSPIGRMAMVIFHPATMETISTAEQTDQLLDALDRLEMETVMLYPNIDVNSDVIAKRIESFAAERSFVHLMGPLPLEDYLSFMGNADVLIGNSSAGIIEAPSFALPAVNVGNRQKGRDCMENVIHVPNDRRAICEAVDRALNDAVFKQRVQEVRNGFGDGNASEKVADILATVNLSHEKRSCFKGDN